VNASEPVSHPTPDASRGAPLLKLALPLVALGALLTILALSTETGRSRIGYGYLLGFAFVWTIVVGSLFFVALQHVTGTVWSVVLRRVAEMLAAPAWLLVLFFVPLALAFLYGRDTFPLFSWMDPDVVHGDHLLEGKAPYLNLPFFLVRAGAFFLVWVLFAGFFVRRSIQQDTGSGNPSSTRLMRKLSAPFMILFGFTVTFAAFDWVMSLEPHWFSTIFGVYVFSGMVVSSLAAITMAVVLLRGAGILPESLVRRDHIYSLGALLFAFTCFWAYIAFSQFMLIWYGNLPEETIYFIHRTEHGWMPISILLAMLRFVLPFFLLLPRDAKTSPRHLLVVSALVLLGQLVDLYWLIFPQALGGSPRLGYQEIAPTLLLAGILVLYLGLFLKRHRMVAVGDPCFERSRNFHL
jgi:hypothetical protein